MSDDDSIKDALARLRETEPPAEVRNRNRSAVQLALRQPTGVPWWRRSISVPLPAALLAAAALLISLTIHLTGSEASDDLNVRTNSHGGDKDAATALVASTDPHVEYSESQRYLSGVGVIDRSMYYKTVE